MELLAPQAPAVPPLPQPAAPRVASIDVLRALTMVLMIFVNDLWTLRNIPAWLEHVAPGVDGIGLADVVFPAFLFLVGMSLPYALDARRGQGNTPAQMVLHVVSRSVALLVMGVFLVNGETIRADVVGIPRFLWYPLCCICFILIWNVYPVAAPKRRVWLARGAGMFTLLVLALLYRGGPDGQQHFAPQWWGILGLIGWAYLAGGLLAVWARNRIPLVAAAWIFFALLSMAAHAGILPQSKAFNSIPDAIRGGTLTALVVGGMLAALVLQRFNNQRQPGRLAASLFAMAAVLWALALLTRPYWKLAKLDATPAWLFLCSALTLLAFLVVFWLVDAGHKAHWFRFIRPAGTDTLLCYLVPYFAYAWVGATGWYLPGVLLTGGPGLVKSMVFALLCVQATGWLRTIGVRLKL